MQLFANANYEFMNHRRKAYAVSLTVILIGLLSMVFHKGLNYSIDFAGGSILEVRIEPPVPIEDIRTAVAGIQAGTFEVQTFGDPRDVMLSLESTGLTGEFGTRVMDTLRRDFPDRTVEIRREESVGPRIGRELRSKALLAILVANLGILIYITLRFEVRFAVAAVLALVHDVLVTLGVFSLMNREISLTVVAAFLTIIGYSLNDTIVVFDRIREDLRLYARLPYDRVLNTAVNRTLSRTILTGGTTLLAVLFLLFAGGSVIRDFSLVLFVGIVTGTYSSVYVASAIVLDWHNHGVSRSKAKTLARATK